MCCLAYFLWLLRRNKRWMDTVHTDSWCRRYHVTNDVISSPFLTLQNLVSWKS